MSGMADRHDRIRREHLANDWDALAREVEEDPQGFTPGVAEEVARVARNTAEKLREGNP